MTFDSITVAPYMGADSVKPFLEFEGKWVILLAHTSNSGAKDFQLLETRDGKKLYEEVLIRSQAWGSPEQLMYVVGATQADKIGEIRKLVPEHFFLVPGIGAQGGDLEQVSRYGMNKQCGLLVNSARAIIYASGDKDFAAVAGREAEKVRDEMSGYLEKFMV
jgi:orotidine-5'-phosphate decarboxylase